MKKLILCFLLSIAPLLTAGEEAIGFGINDFNHCGASNLWYSKGFADRFIDAFQDKKSDGKWDSAIKKYDDHTDAADFTDKDKHNIGADSAHGLGVDHADVGFLSSHGGAFWTDNPGAYVYNTFTMGEKWWDGSSWRSSVDSTGEMKFGHDLEIFIGATCKSMQLNFWLSGGVHKAWESGNTLQFWLGFHGISYDSLTDRNRVRDYAKTSFYNGLGANWVEELTRGRGLSPDQCATVLIRGTSESKIITNYEYAGFKDRGKDYGGTWIMEGYFGIKGCDPKGGAPL